MLNAVKIIPTRVTHYFYISLSIFSLSLGCEIQALDVDSGLREGDQMVGGIQELDYKPAPVMVDMVSAGSDQALDMSADMDLDMTAGTEAGGIEAGEQAGQMVDMAAGEIPSCLPRTELCNGEDDDCDGNIDEDFDGLGEPCYQGLGACRGEGQFVCGDSMANLSCLVVEGTPSEELCDRVDNDCDGPIDEGLVGCCTSGVTQRCGSDIGACSSGSQDCVEGEWSECDDVRPTEEVCDGADNDCDERIDEGVLNICGHCGVVPTEICNGEDEDCDGRLDEGTLNACGECGDLPAESCNGEDEDCDGRTDEGTLNACGECSVLPIEVCDMQDNDCDGRTDENVTNACGSCGAIPVEVCDLQDNDCDGRADENLVTDPCSEGIGECRRTGILRCVGGEFGCSVVAAQPSSEVCNGLDDDCDGQTDEGEICVELCNGQDEDMDGQIDEGVLNACGMCGAVPAETCDGQDNDCDGSIDELVLNPCGICGPIPEEVCDGQDNDCDGSTDEGVQNACGVCGALPVEVCDLQDNDCDGQFDENVLNACGSCGQVPTERCNHFDDDCDGEIDETFPLLGTQCSSGVGECARTGVFICDGPNLACDTPPLGTADPESCNERDDDCDGRIDEGFNLRSDFFNCGQCLNYCGGQGDRCQDGICFCGPERVTCSIGEICNGGRCQRL